MTDKGRELIHIPANAEYIEILGHRIDGYESFEAFLEHLNRYAELEETVERQKAEIGEQDKAILSALKRMGEIREETASEIFAEIEGLKNRTKLSFNSKELQGLEKPINSMIRDAIDLILLELKNKYTKGGDQT